MRAIVFSLVLLYALDLGAAVAVTHYIDNSLWAPIVAALVQR